MLVPTKRILGKAHRGRYAIGAFNFNNMEMVQGVIAAAEELKAPVLIQTTEGAIKYAGLKYLHAIGMAAAEQAKVPVCLHLDHGRDWDVIKSCVKIGYSSIMYDGSHLSFKENIKMTRKVVNLAHKHGISVEAELGTIGGVEDLVSARKIIYTDPDEAQEFVEKTGCDYLAVAIGTSHGAYKFAGKSSLDFTRLEVLKKRLKMPLVLHGASTIPPRLVKQANKYGAKIAGAHGVSFPHIKKAAKLGINKFNTDSDLRIAFDAGMRKFLKEKPKDFDPRHILGAARELVADTAKERMKYLGCAGKA